MGGKRVRIDGDSEPKKKKNCGSRSFVGYDDDRISQLPDDILVVILCLLSLKEAGRTSVLSSRWINLWKNTHSLNFDGKSQSSSGAKPGESSGQENSLEAVEKRYKLFKRERRKYMKWVNSVIQSHKSPTLKLFRIRYPLDTSDRNSVTRWLQFASSRQVQSLELDFHDYKYRRFYYRFPEELFAPSSTVFEFKSLKSLFFKNVNVSGGAIELFLRNCPLLEKLIVHSSAQISKIEVCGPSLLLKHLEIVYCPGLESLKISAPALTSLTVSRLKGVMLENVPVLVDVSVDCDYCGYCVKNFLSVLRCCISQLESLNLVRSRSRIKPETKELCNFPEMPRLKKLAIEYGAFDDESFSRLSFLTRVSPYLEEFVLMNKWVDGSMESRRVNDDDAIISFRHEHLKVFKFCGYRGRPSDVALVRYMLKNCVVLEKIVIDPSSVYFNNRLSRVDVEEAARKEAKQLLRPLLPHHVELIIL